MYNLDQFHSKFRDGNMSISCDDSVQRADVIAKLLDLGYDHGISGYSRRMLMDTTVEENNWLNVFCGSEHGIEFCNSSHVYNRISYDDFLLVAGYRYHVAVDDLL